MNPAHLRINCQVGSLIAISVDCRKIRLNCEGRTIEVMRKLYKTPHIHLEFSFDHRIISLDLSKYLGEKTNKCPFL